MPEEAPAEQVADDADRHDTGRGEEGGDGQAVESSGGAEGVRRQATGNPDNAG
jgi:hypothetical protein